MHTCCVADFTLSTKYTIIAAHWLSFLEDLTSSRETALTAHRHRQLDKRRDIVRQNYFISGDTQYNACGSSIFAIYLADRVITCISMYAFMC